MVVVFCLPAPLWRPHVSCIGVKACPTDSESGARHQAQATPVTSPTAHLRHGHLSCLPPPPTVSMLSMLDTPVFLLDHAAPTLAWGPEDKSFSGGASLAMVTTFGAREEEDLLLFQELEAKTDMPDFLSDDFPCLECW
jgi:hypothetical protein